MRFKSLPERTQVSIAQRVADFVSKQPADHLYPAAEVGVWWGALLHHNARISGNGFPSSDAFLKVVESVEYILFGPASEHGTCDCCGTEY